MPRLDTLSKLLKKKKKFTYFAPSIFGDDQLFYELKREFRTEIILVDLSVIFEQSPQAIITEILRVFISFLGTETAILSDVLDSYQKTNLSDQIQLKISLLLDLASIHKNTKIIFLNVDHLLTNGSENNFSLLTFLDTKIDNLVFHFADLSILTSIQGRSEQSEIFKQVETIPIDSIPNFDLLKAQGIAFNPTDETSIYLSKANILKQELGNLIIQKINFKELKENSFECQMLLDSGLIGKKGDYFTFRSEILDFYLSLKVTTKKKSYLVKLTTNEELLFKFLKSKQGKVVTKSEIAKKLWGKGEGFSDLALAKVISRLKEKLQKLGVDKRVTSIKNEGYKLD